MLTLGNLCAVRSPSHPFHCEASCGYQTSPPISKVSLFKYSWLKKRIKKIWSNAFEEIMSLIDFWLGTVEDTQKGHYGLWQRGQ